MSIYKIFRGGC